MTGSSFEVVDRVPEGDEPSTAGLVDERVEDARAVLVAVAAWTGATVAPSAAGATPAIVLALGIGLLAMVRRSSAALVLAVLLGAAWSGARAELGFVPLETGALSGVATVVGDPEPRWPAWTIDLRIDDGRRVRAVGYGRSADSITRATIGDRVHVVGRGRPVDTGWLRARHVVGVVSLDRFEPAGADPGLLTGARRLGEDVRDRIVAGAESLEPDRRALYTGLVLGDDRFQSDGQRARFRLAGLTHLLAVSGQNVAFVLVVAGPLLRWLPVRARFVLTMLLLLWFAGVTRYEPSVLRATVTAGLAAWASLGGRHRTGVRILALAVAGLIVIDPFLVGVMAFRLSVAASAGILLLGPTLTRRLPGPRWFAEPLAVTLAAQIGVGPLLVVGFGPISMATVPANLAAGWAAAGVMMLGLTVGVAAGVAPDPVAGLLMAPVGWLLWWIDAVATVHARLPAPRVGLLGGAALIVGALLVRRPRAVGPSGASAWSMVFRAGVAVAMIVVSARSLPRSPEAPAACGPGAHYLPAVDHHPSVLILTGEARDRTVDDCVTLGVRSVDLVLVGTGDHRANRVVSALDQVIALGSVRAPPQHRVVGARRVTEVATVETGWGLWLVEPSADGRRLRIEPVSPRRR